MLTKKQFMTAANAIVKQVELDDKMSKLMQILCPETHAFYTTKLLEPAVELLEQAANDECGWFSYWLFELEQGKKYKRGTVKIDGKCVRLKTLDDVWKFIQDNKKV